MTAQIEILPRMRLWFLHANVDGRRHLINIGAWAIFVPKAQLKVLHSRAGRQHCISHRAPKRSDIARAEAEAAGKLAQWRRVYARSVTRRVAQNWVAMERLYSAGIGPEPLSLVVVPRYRAWFSGGLTFSAGYRVANLYDYPPRPAPTEEDMRNAGVAPDRKLACLREHINGYISDLNALWGVMPIDAEDEVEALTARLDAALAQAGAKLS